MLGSVCCLTNRPKRLFEDVFKVKLLFVFTGCFVAFPGFRAEIGIEKKDGRMADCGWAKISQLG